MKKRGILLMAVAALSMLMSVTFADRVGGGVSGYHVVNARSSKSFSESFYKGRLAGVLVSGDGDTDLDLYIYDRNGALVAYDDDPTDDCLCLWTPRYTGKYTIKVVNRGYVYNEFYIAAD
ncbi:MAG: hypothetical protein KIT45_05185 [Fimbriimonadia bacterium]|nr:hypothetical protein [Fimbriimonadia bacterium]